MLRLDHPASWGGKRSLILVAADHHDGMACRGWGEDQNEAADQQAEPKPATVGIQHELT
jgi:hypothetical protein